MRTKTPARFLLLKLFVMRTLLFIFLSFLFSTASMANQPNQPNQPNHTQKADSSTTSSSQESFQSSPKGDNASQDPKAPGSSETEQKPKKGERSFKNNSQQGNSPPPPPMAQYSVLKSLKSGFVHLPAEIVRFTTAIVIVRLATCFGPSLWNNMSFKPRVTDPVCIQELQEMLVDPIFYAGFSSFVLASRASSPIMFGILQKLDPKNGPVSRATARWVIPQFAMAIGFIADHVVRTLLENQSIQQCLLSLVGKRKSLDESQSLGTTTNEEGEEFKIYDYYQSVGGSPCKRAGHYISSDQLLKEELGVGIASLTSAALSLSVLQAGGSKLLQTSSRIGLGSLLLRASLVVSLATGPVGIAIRGVVHMVAFLALAEVMTPYISSAYYLSFMEAKLDGKTQSFNEGYRGFSEVKDKIKELSHQFNENIEKLKKFKPMRGYRSPMTYPLMGRGLYARPKPKCSEHYSGHNENGGEPLCSSIPMLTEIISFHDYSKTWRQNKILGKFNLSVIRWQKKLNSFFLNYHSSRDQMTLLSRSREIFLTGKSQELESFKTELSQVRDDESIDPEYRDFLLSFSEDKLKSLEDSSSFNKNGSYYYGLLGKEEPEDEEVDFVIDKIIEFIDGGPVYSHINHYSRHTYTNRGPFSYQTRETIRNLGLELELPFSIDKLRKLLLSGNEEDRVYGLVLFKNWLPFMYGHLPATFNIDDNVIWIDGKPQRSRGFRSHQQRELYEDLVRAFEEHDPLFKYEYFYIESTFGKLGQLEKTKTDGQWDESLHGMDTSKLYAHTLTNLICGSGFSLFKEGTAMKFEFPKILEEDNICENIYQPVFDPEQKRLRPLVTRSQFTTSYGLYRGIHQAYIQAPDSFGETNPLLFDTESQAGKWWDAEILPQNIQVIQKMKAGYEKMINEQLIPHLSSEEPETPGVRVGKLFKNLSALGGRSQKRGKCRN